MRVGCDGSGGAVGQCCLDRWAGVEGAEDLILEPFLAKAPPHLLPKILILENGVLRWQTDLPRLLEESGYGLRATTRQNLVFERNDGDAGHG